MSAAKVVAERHPFASLKAAIAAAVAGYGCTNGPANIELAEFLEAEANEYEQRARYICFRLKVDIAKSTTKAMCQVPKAGEEILHALEGIRDAQAKLEAIQLHSCREPEGHGALGLRLKCVATSSTLFGNAYYCQHRSCAPKGSGNRFSVRELLEAGRPIDPCERGGS